MPSSSPPTPSLRSWAVAAIIKCRRWQQGLHKTKGRLSVKSTVNGHTEVKLQIVWLYVFTAIMLSLSYDFLRKLQSMISTRLGMHDIYRTYKWSTDMGENYVIFIALINKLNSIFRSDKVRLLVNQSMICLIYLRFIRFPSASDCSFKLQWLSACVALITSSFVNMSLLVWKFLSVAEENNTIAICITCSVRIPRGGKKASSFNTTNLISH